MYALLENFQWQTRNEPLTYAGRVHSVHFSRASLFRAYGTIKADGLALGRNRIDLAGVEVKGRSIPQQGEEVMHNRVSPIFFGG